MRLLSVLVLLFSVSAMAGFGGGRSSGGGSVGRSSGFSSSSRSSGSSFGGYRSSGSKPATITRPSQSSTPFRSSAPTEVHHYHNSGSNSMLNWMMFWHMTQPQQVMVANPNGGYAMVDQAPQSRGFLSILLSVIAWIFGIIVVWLLITMLVAWLGEV